MTEESTNPTRRTAVILVMGSFICAGFLAAEVLTARVEAETSYDLGAVVQGQEIAVPMDIRNTGLVPLRIRSIENDCDSVTTNGGVYAIPPGENLRLTTVLTTDRVDGDLRRTIAIYTNDRRANPLRILVMARVEREFDISDAIVDFGDVVPGATVTHQISVSPRPGVSHDILAIESTAPGVTAVRRIHGSQTNVNRDVIIDVQLQPIHKPRASMHEPRTIVGNILIRTSSSFMPVLRIPVRGYVVEVDGNFPLPVET
jgi:hypothetical protein